MEGCRSPDHQGTGQVPGESGRLEATMEGTSEDDVEKQTSHNHQLSEGSSDRATKSRFHNLKTLQLILFVQVKVAQCVCDT